MREQAQKPRCSGAVGGGHGTHGTFDRFHFASSSMAPQARRQGVFTQPCTCRNTGTCRTCRAYAALSVFCAALGAPR